jgi:hypothetical protein
MIQLRMGQQKLEAKIDAQAVTLEGLKETQRENHKQNRESIHDIRGEQEIVSANVALVTMKLDNYLLVQSTRDEQKDKAWWKQPLGTGIIVLGITFGLKVLERYGLHW